MIRPNITPLQVLLQLPPAVQLLAVPADWKPVLGQAARETLHSCPFRCWLSYRPALSASCHSHAQIVGSRRLHKGSELNSNRPPATTSLVVPPNPIVQMAIEPTVASRELVLLSGLVEPKSLLGESDRGQSPPGRSRMADGILLHEVVSIETTSGVPTSNTVGHASPCCLCIVAVEAFDVETLVAFLCY